MVRAGVKMPSFCLNRIRPHVRVRSPPIQFKLDVNIPTKTNPTSETSGDENSGPKPGGAITIIGRKIMIVVDSSIEAKNALQWVLTHAVQNPDILILLYVTKPCKQGDKSSKEIPSRVPDFLCIMKNMCKLKRPEVQIEIVVAEGKEKGPTVVEEAKKREVAMLVLGQKKRPVSWRLLMIWAGNNNRVGEDVVEYCIQNASCMAIAVRRKNKKVGGYLITTKRHKDFWLLA